MKFCVCARNWVANHVLFHFWDLLLKYYLYSDFEEAFLPEDKRYLGCIHCLFHPVWGVFSENESYTVLCMVGFRRRTIRFKNLYDSHVNWRHGRNSKHSYIAFRFNPSNILPFRSETVEALVSYLCQQWLPFSSHSSLSHENRRFACFISDEHAWKIFVSNPKPFAIHQFSFIARRFLFILIQLQVRASVSSVALS